MKDYADKITAERVRRVIKGYPSSLRAKRSNPVDSAATDGIATARTASAPRNDEEKGVL